MYEKARRGFEDTTNTREKGVVLTKEDKAHGSLLVIQELVRNGCSEGEVGTFLGSLIIYFENILA